MRSVIGDRRSIIRKKLHSIYLPYYDLICAELGPEWQPYQGYRTFKSQDDLFEIGRTMPGNKVTNARGGESPHCYGLATDWCLWDENDRPIWPDISDKRWFEYESVVVKSGLTWGGFFLMRDNPHNELSINTTWKRVKAEYDKLGIDAAYEFVRINI